MRLEHRLAQLLDTQAIQPEPGSRKMQECIILRFPETEYSYRYLVDTRYPVQEDQDL
jgi:hypothetical protein